MEARGTGQLAETAPPSGAAGARPTHDVTQGVRGALASLAAVAAVGASGTRQGAARAVPSDRAVALARDGVAVGSVGAVAPLGTVPSVAAGGACSSACRSSQTIRAGQRTGSCCWITFGVLGACAALGTLLSPRSRWAWLLASLARVTVEADAFASLGVAAGGVSATALAWPAATGAVGESRTGQVAVAPVPPRWTLAVTEVAVAPCARTVVGTPSIAARAEEAEGTDVIAAVPTKRVSGAAAASRLGMARSVTFAQALFLTTCTVCPLGTSVVAGRSSVSRMTAAGLCEGIALSLLTVSARVLALFTKEPWRASG